MHNIEVVCHLQHNKLFKTAIYGDFKTSNISFRRTGRAGKKWFEYSYPAGKKLSEQ